MGRTPRKPGRSPQMPTLFRHSPDVTDKFDNTDLLATTYPLPGIQFHNDPALAQWVEKYGNAPDVLFRQGLAAPPLGKNHSGLRHYTVDFTGDPNRVINLDVPLTSQIGEIRDRLKSLGIDNEKMVQGRPGDHGTVEQRPQTVLESLWEKGMRDSYMRNRYLTGRGFVWPTNKEFEGLAKLGANGGPFEPYEMTDVYHGAADSLLKDFNRVGIQGASGRGSGFSAGTAYAPASVGRSPWKGLLEDADAARARGDILEAQSLENEAAAMMESNGKPSMVWGPNTRPKQYSIFDPDAVSIRRIASILAAAGVGAAAGTAQAGDRYGDRTSGFSSPPVPPPSKGWFGGPEAWGSPGPSGPGFDYVFGTSSGGAQRTPGTLYDYLSDADLSPEDMERFHSAPPPEHQAFKQAFDKAVQMPVVRLPDEVITPDQFLSRSAPLAAKQMGLPYPSGVDSVENAKRIMRGERADPTDPVAPVLVDALLGHMRETLPDGRESYGWEPGASPAQVKDFAKDGLNARYRLTPEGQQGFQSERVMNLLSTFQNGERRPVFADMGSRLAARAVAPIDLAQDSTMRNLATWRNNTPEGRLNESLYWWNEGQPNGYAAGSLSGAKYPSISSTTTQGIATKLDSTDNYIPRNASQAFEQSLFNQDVPQKEFDQLQRLRDSQLRITPHNPEGVDPVQIRQLRKDIRDFQANSRGWANAAYPIFAQDYLFSPQAWGGVENPPPVKPQFLSRAGEMVANLPRDYLDLQTVASLGSGLIRQLFRKGIRAVPGMATRAAVDFASDMPQENAANLAMDAVNNANRAEPIGMFDPQPYSLVTDDHGDPIPADHPEYRRHYQRALESRQNELRRILGIGTTMYGDIPNTAF